MEIEHSIVLDASPDSVFALVDDLDRYPQWMELIHDVAVESSSSGEPPAWVSSKKPRMRF